MSSLTSDFKNNPLHGIKLNDIMNELTCVLEYNEIEMDIVCWGGRGNKKIIKIPYFGHLRYDRFKQNLKSNDFTHSLLEALSNNIEGIFHQV